MRKTSDQAYEKKSPGINVITSTIWAGPAAKAGKASDYLVSNNEDGSDAYCISAEKFESVYEPEEAPWRKWRKVAETVGGRNCPFSEARIRVNSVQRERGGPYGTD